MSNTNVDFKADNKRYSRQLRDMLLLRFEPIAIKMIEDEADVPENAIRPQKDMGTHMALCQAFSLARREYKTIYMVKEDHWCWNPLIGLGHVDSSEGTETFDVVCTALGVPDMDKARAFFAKFPRFPLGKYKGIVTAPLSECGFDPDVVLIYSNNSQLRSMLWGIKAMTGHIVETVMDAIDSCVYAIVVPIQTGEYQVTIPDIGEFERAAPNEDEIILSVPQGHMQEVIDGMRYFEERSMGYTGLKRELDLDYSRPPFYNELYKLWGLEQGKDRT